MSLKLKLTELLPSVIVNTRAHVHEGTLANYDMIIGQDDLMELGLRLCFDTQTVEWPCMNAVIPMKSRNATELTEFFISDTDTIEEDTERLSKILHSKYSRTDLPSYVEEQAYLSSTERESLLSLLQQYEPLFDGTLGQRKGEPYHIQLKEDATPYHGRPYTVPRAYECTLQVELERLV